MQQPSRADRVSRGNTSRLSFQHNITPPAQCGQYAIFCRSVGMGWHLLLSAVSQVRTKGTVHSASLAFQGSVCKCSLRGLYTGAAQHSATQNTGFPSHKNLTASIEVYNTALACKENTASHLNTRKVAHPSGQHWNPIYSVNKSTLFLCRFLLDTRLENLPPYV